jgi:NADPH-dependent 2,4-dienoyl-CoA reductase/sulfur reductase-like enzyme/rhodanese-related sulfurtransferase
MENNAIMKNIVIIGGVAGGASFAARMRRLDESANIIMVEKGEFISFANCGLPYHIGETIQERDDLIIQTPRQFFERFNIDVRVRSEAVSVNPAEKTVTIRNRDGEYRQSFDYLLLAPGCAPVRPKITGIDSPAVCMLRTIPDMDHIKGMIDKGGVKRTVVIGGGFIGLEMAENLRRRGLAVAVVELLDQVFAPMDREMASILHQHLAINGVRLLTGHGVSRIADDGSGIASVILDDGTMLPAELAVLAVGVTPDTRFLESSGILLSGRGAIVVNERLQTNYPFIYAAGDAVEVEDFVSGTKTLVPLAGPANRQGRIAADNIAGIPTTYKKTLGTAICKVFDLTAAVAGINEKTAKRLKIPYTKSYTHSTSHASYYPGAFFLSIKLLFAPDTGRVLGAQIIGKEGVDKRIDVLATAIRHCLTVDELGELELAYAPPFSSAKDPVNIAGFVAQNIRGGRMLVFYSEEVKGIDAAKQQLLDVRTIEEHEAGNIPNSLCIPIDSLRGRLKELDATKEIMVYCRVGLRGYLATRILLENGFTAKNLSGGYITWLGMQTPDDAAYLAAITEHSCATPASGKNSP